jgi:predicted amino acid racemase
LPSKDNLQLLSSLADEVEQRLGFHLDTISVGGSAILDWMREEALPDRVNQIRVGESILLGTVPGSNTRHPDLHDNTMYLEATIVEMKSKPSAPTGVRGGDAFGFKKDVSDLGIRRRAILDFGVVDTDPRDLVVTEAGMAIVVSNSDYTVVDVTECSRRFLVGGKIKFGLRYKSMLQSFLSPTLSKMVAAHHDHVPDIAQLF